MSLSPFKLFDPGYLFDPRPGSEFLFFWPLVILFVAVFVASFKVEARGIAARMREFSSLGLLFTFLRDQNIPYLGMRFFIVLIFLAAMIYAVWHWKQSEKKADLKPALAERRDNMDKYLPKKKNRR